MKLYAIVETNNNRLVSFVNTLVDIPGCYLIPDIEPASHLIGKKYNNGIWEDVEAPISEEDEFTSEYAKALNRV
jgi:hypothetical protein